MDEPRIAHAVFRPGGNILELGCGAGRVTRELLKFGYEVTAVDQSQDMLIHIRGAETVLSDIESLDLGRRFEGVMLASNLVNTADDGQRGAFLRSCARHVAPDGVVLFQRYAPDWDPSTDEPIEYGGVRIEVLAGRRYGSTVEGVIEYSAAGRSWTQPFAGRILDDRDLSDSLAEAGLALQRVLDPAGSWVVAGPS